MDEWIERKMHGIELRQMEVVVLCVPGVGSL